MNYCELIAKMTFIITQSSKSLVAKSVAITYSLNLLRQMNKTEAFKVCSLPFSQP